MKLGTRIAAVSLLPLIASEGLCGRAQELRETVSRLLFGSAVAGEVAR